MNKFIFISICVIIHSRWNFSSIVLSRGTIVICCIRCFSFLRLSKLLRQSGFCSLLRPQSPAWEEDFDTIFIFLWSNGIEILEEHFKSRILVKLSPSEWDYEAELWTVSYEWSLPGVPSGNKPATDESDSNVINVGTEMWKRLEWAETNFTQPRTNHFSLLCICHLFLQEWNKRQISAGYRLLVKSYLGPWKDNLLRFAAWNQFSPLISGTQMK